MAKKVLTQEELDKQMAVGDPFELQEVKNEPKNKAKSEVIDNDIDNFTNSLVNPSKKAKSYDFAKLKSGDEKYICPENEKDLVHVLQDKEKFDANGNKISVPRIQIYNVKAFQNFWKNASRNGYKGTRKDFETNEMKEWHGIKILHKPTV